MVRNIFQKHWGILTSTPRLAEIVGPSLKMVTRRAKNLRDMLIKSEFRKEPSTTWLSDFPWSMVMFPCGRCQVCPYVDRSDTFSDSLVKRDFQIRNLIKCSMARMIYMLTCPCDKIYIGKTKHPLKIRIGEHIREIKAEDPEKPLAWHFVKYHDGNLESMSLKGIHALKLPPKRDDFNLILLQIEKW